MKMTTHSPSNDASTSPTPPNWLKFDPRTMVDEYFRGSYTLALGADGDAGFSF